MPETLETGAARRAKVGYKLPRGYADELRRTHPTTEDRTRCIANRLHMIVSDSVSPEEKVMMAHAALDELEVFSGRAL